VNINYTVQSGNLTRDPELNTYGQTTICKMRLAVNDRMKDPNTGEWKDRPNYFDVDVFGGQGERCAQYLRRGSKITVEGKLRWREWEAQDGSKRQAVSIAASNVEWPPKADSQGGGAYAGSASNTAPPASNAPPQEDFREQAHQDTAETFRGDDDIPF